MGPILNYPEPSRGRASSSRFSSGGPLSEASIISPQIPLPSRPSRPPPTLWTRACSGPRRVVAVLAAVFFAALGLTGIAVSVGSAKDTPAPHVVPFGSPVGMLSMRDTIMSISERSSFFSEYDKERFISEGMGVLCGVYEPLFEGLEVANTAEKRPLTAERWQQERVREECPGQTFAGNRTSLGYLKTTALAVREASGVYPRFNQVLATAIGVSQGLQKTCQKSIIFFSIYQDSGGPFTRTTVVLQVPTGQGKTWITAMTASLLAMHGHHCGPISVTVITPLRTLAAQDYRLASRLYQADALKNYRPGTGTTVSMYHVWRRRMRVV